MAVSVIVQNVSENHSVPGGVRFREWVAAVFAGRTKGEVGIRIVDEEEARALNRQYRGSDYATNVLAFPCGDDFAVAGGLDTTDSPIGDIVICAAVVEREAREQNKDLDAHWAHMAIHGALHLDGFDHVTDEQAEVMEARETLLLAHFGFPDPWEMLAQTSPALHHKT